MIEYRIVAVDEEMDMYVLGIEVGGLAEGSEIPADIGLDDRDFVSF